MSLLERICGSLEQRTSRQGFLVRSAVVGSALTVAPLRFLLRPQTALAAIVRPSECAGGRCSDGWTEFCCTINEGKNMCPPYSYVAGWWKCTDYRGRRLCAEEGVRYYVDCNRTPGQQVPGGCHCAHGSCDHRRVACNVFRYGQCNTHVPGVTEVVCRVVVCDHPATVPDFHCNRTYKENDATCPHEAGCLPEQNLQEFSW